MALTKEDLVKILAAFSDDEATPTPASKEPEKPVTPSAEESKEVEELKARLAALEANNKPAEPTSPEEEKEAAEVKELREKIAEQETERIRDSIKNGLSTSGLDEDHVKVLGEFFAYDKLKTEDGTADTEKITSLVGALTNIALRKPPTGGATKAYDPSLEGLAKYLKMEVN